MGFCELILHSGRPVLSLIMFTFLARLSLKANQVKNCGLFGVVRYNYFFCAGNNGDTVTE